jgi:AraC-like DNA-binding protein
MFALRRALWDVAERAQRAIAQFEMYVKTRGAGDPDATDIIATVEGDSSQQPRAVPIDPLSGALAVRAALRPGHSREVARALRHIELHFERPIGMARLARVAGCSRSTLTRAFRREVGQTPHAYLVGIRLARAAGAMASGDKIEAVMLSAGFRSKRNFYRLFKAQYGRTPAQFSQAPPNQPDAPGSTSTRTGSA